MDNPIPLNTASIEELTSLPGIGKALAERIVAARPFDSAADLERVEGIGPASMQKLFPLITVEETPSPDETKPVTEPETAGTEDIAFSEDTTREREEEIEVEAKPQPEEDISNEPSVAPTTGVTARQTWGIALVTGLLSIILTLALVFGIFVGLNGGLRFVRPAELDPISRQVDGLELQLNMLEQDVDSLRTRVANFEDFGQQIETLNADLEQLAEQTKALDAEISALQNDNARFTSFLEGLRDLLLTVAKPDNIP